MIAALLVVLCILGYIFVAGMVWGYGHPRLEAMRKGCSTCGYLDGGCTDHDGSFEFATAAFWPVALCTVLIFFAVVKPGMSVVHLGERVANLPHQRRERREQRVAAMRERVAELEAELGIGR